MLLGPSMSSSFLSYVKKKNVIDFWTWRISPTIIFSVLFHGSVSTHILMCCLWRLEDTPSGCSLYAISPLFEIWFLIDLKFSDWFRLENKPQRSACVNPFIPWHCIWILSIELRVMLLGQTLYWLNFLSSLHNVLFYASDGLLMNT